MQKDAPDDGDFNMGVNSYRNALEIYTPESHPRKYRQTLRSLGDLYFHKGRWSEAYETYSSAMAAGEMLQSATYSEAGRRSEIWENSEIYSNAAFCLIKLGNVSEALLKLEQGKARLLSEALYSGAAALLDLSREEKDALISARKAVRTLEADMRKKLGSRRNVMLGEELKRARLELVKLTGDTGKKSHGPMPSELDLKGILAQVPEGGAFVLHFVTSVGGAAVVVTHCTGAADEPDAVMLDDLRDETFRSILTGDLKTPGWILAYVSSRSNSEKLKEILDSLTRNLWDTMMGPIWERLKEKGIARGAPVVLIPQGGINMLPLHAAWFMDGGKRHAFLDDYQVSYSPSIYSFSISTKNAKRLQNLKPALLAAINPTNDLNQSLVEGRAVASLFGQENLVLEGDAATKEKVIKEAANYSYLHFACHGKYDWREAMNSGLSLASDDQLTLSEIVSHLDLNSSRLVTLSACETGITEFIKTPDEYIGLPAGFLQSMVPGVISTLWVVDDMSTAMLMLRFYSNHVIERMHPGKALREAQLWLRDSTRSELGKLYGSLILNIEGASFEVYSKLMSGDENEKPFSNPFYWAAFTFTGD